MAQIDSPDRYPTGSMHFLDMDLHCIGLEQTRVLIWIGSLARYETIIYQLLQYLAFAKKNYNNVLFILEDKLICNFWF